MLEPETLTPRQKQTWGGGCFQDRFLDLGLALFKAVTELLGLFTVHAGLPMRALAGL